MDFLTGLAPSRGGILCTSPSFQLGGAHVGNIPGNKSRYPHNTAYSNVLYFSSTFSNCRIAPSGKFLSPYNTPNWKNTGLPDVINYLSYCTWELQMVPSGNSYYNNIMWVGKFFWISFICTQSVTLIIRLMYSIYSASRRWKRYYLCLLSAVLCNRTYTHSWPFGYIQILKYIC